MGTMDSVTRETAVMQDMSCCSLGVLDSVTSAIVYTVMCLPLVYWFKGVVRSEPHLCDEYNYYYQKQLVTNSFIKGLLLAHISIILPNTIPCYDLTQTGFMYSYRVLLLVTAVSPHFA